MEGTLFNFQIGISRDGTNCMMVFVDEDRRTTTCSASFTEFSHFIANLTRSAEEMALRRAEQFDPEQTLSPGAVNASSAAFRLCAHDGYLLGALASDAGEVVGIRMGPGVASQMTRAMLLTLPAATAS